MRTRTKIAIFLAALLITFLGFNLMVPSAAVELVNARKYVKSDFVYLMLADAAGVAQTALAGR